MFTAARGQENGGIPLSRWKTPAPAEAHVEIGMTGRGMSTMDPPLGVALVGLGPALRTAERTPAGR